MSERATKGEVNYGAGTAEEHCGICSMYVRPKSIDHHGTCTAVRGDISPTAWCRLFEPKKRAAGGSVLNQVGQHNPGLHLSHVLAARYRGGSNK